MIEYQIYINTHTHTSAHTHSKSVTFYTEVTLEHKCWSEFWNERLKWRKLNDCHLKLKTWS